MKISIINIGNSKGIRLPKAILEQYHLTDKVEMILEKESIVLKPIKNPREGWSEAFSKFQKTEGDELLIQDVFEDENFEEWVQ